MKQLRFDFPDYSARQQEIDAKRAEWLKITEVYISKVDGVWNAIIPKKHNIVINGNNGEDLTEFCTNLKQSLIEDFNIKPQFRCIQNIGLDEYFRKNMEIIRRLQNGFER